VPDEFLQRFPDTNHPDGQTEEVEAFVFGAPEVKNLCGSAGKELQRLKPFSFRALFVADESATHKDSRDSHGL
jgi:hypothetical protein